LYDNQLKHILEAIAQTYRYHTYRYLKRFIVVDDDIDITTREKLNGLACEPNPMVKCKTIDIMALATRLRQS
jgi:hypothetical protein